MNRVHIIITMLLELTFCLPLQAQQAEGRWSIYASGALGSWQNINSDLYTGDPIVSPEVSLGASWKWLPAVRLNAEAAYTLLRERNDKITSTVLTDENFMLGGHKTTLTTQADCLQNKNRQHAATLQVTADYYLSSLWQKGKPSPFSLYAGAGMGIITAWATNTRTTAYNAEAIAEGDDYSNIYQHAYVKSEKQEDNYTTFCIPVALSAEYDVLPNVTIGARGQVKWLPAASDIAPKTMTHAGLLLRIRW